MSAEGTSKLEDNEDVLTEILLRLPVKSLLRVRAVSKQWRRVAASPYFLAAYSLRKPQEIIVFHYFDKPVILPKSGVAMAAEICVAPIVATGRSGSSVAFRHLGLNGDPGLVACRDGLLLMSRGDDSFLVVNPAIGQGTVLPSPIPSRRALLKLSGFYPHHSGEYRVLCYAEEERKEDVSCSNGNGNGNGNGNYYILSTSVAEARLVNAGVTPEAPNMPGVVIHGSLHWLLMPKHPASLVDESSAGAHDDDADELVVVDNMLAFDTVSEKFRLMAPPPVAASYHAPHLFDMRGELAASAVRDPPHVDVRALEDYHGDGGRMPARERWSWRLRVSVPEVRGIYSLALKASALSVIEGDVLVVQNEGLILLHDMVAKSTRAWVHLRMRNFSCDLWLQGFYRESLAPVTSPPTKV